MSWINHTWIVKQCHVVEYEVPPATALRLVPNGLSAHWLLKEHSVPSDVAYGDGLGDARVKDQDFGLAQERPVSWKLVLKDESKLILKGALLFVGRGTPG